MRISRTYCAYGISAWVLTIAPALAITKQTPENVFHGRSYLYIEAENFASRGTDLDKDGWQIVSVEAPIISPTGLYILPADSNVSGQALLDEIGGSFHTDTAVYELQFLTAGTYQLYLRHSMYDRNGNGNYANEDSFFISPAFNHNSESDWIGFEGLEFDPFDVTVEIPNPGFALDPDGFKPATADSGNDGWMAIRDWGVKSAGIVTFPNDANGPEWNGNFNWYHRPSYVSSNASGSFDSDYGFKTEFTVAPSQVGQTLTFEIGSREPYGVLDGFLFIQDDDVNLLDLYTQAELDAVLPRPPDADFDGSGSVDSDDLMHWATGFGSLTGAVIMDGDANGDFDVDGQDFLHWQRQLTLPTLIAIPEPSSLWMLIGFALVGRGLSGMSRYSLSSASRGALQR